MIHASRTYDRIGEIILLENGIDVPAPHVFHYGAILGKVTVVDCVRMSASRWFFGPWGFVLKNAEEIKPVIPYIGQLGIFDVPDILVKAK